MTNPELASTVEIPKMGREALVVLGRGTHIKVPYGTREKDFRLDPLEQEAIKKRVKSGDTQLLVPTDILEKTEFDDHGKERHPVIGWKVQLGNEQRDSRYAGGILNVVAAVKLAEEKLASGRPFRKIYWAASMLPPELKAWLPKWSEGMVMAKYFLRMASEELLNSGVVMAFEPENANTGHDIAASLKNAAREGCGQVTVVTVGVQLLKAYHIGQDVLETLRILRAEENVPRVDWRASEWVLRDSAWRGVIKLGVKSEGHRVSLAEERKMVAKRKDGSYQSRWTDPKYVEKFANPVVDMTVEEVREFI